MVGTMKGASYISGIALSVVLLLGSCGQGGSKGSATPQAAAEYADLQKELAAFAQEDFLEEDEAEEWDALLRHFARTADARYATPAHKLTMLHLACMFKKPELARCLLLDGADPNARMEGDDGEGGDTPLSLAAASVYAPETPTATAIGLLETLLQAGADIKAQGVMNAPLSRTLYVTCDDEDVFLYLLHRGMELEGTSLWGAAFRGWDRVLTGLLDAGEPPSIDLLHATAPLGGGMCQGRQLLCAGHLLERGFPVDAEDDQGRTALFITASNLRLLQDEGKLDEALEMLRLLLSHGADAFHPAMQDEEYPGFCAYDFFAALPEVLEWLEKEGFSFEPPPFSFRSGTALLGDVCRAAMRQLPPDELAPHFDSLAAVLTPSGSMREQEIYPDALHHALSLMAGIDAERTARAVEAMPFWKDNRLWEQAAVRDALFSTLQELPALVLGKDFLLQQAERMEKAALHDEAATLVEFLARCPDAEEDIDRMCQRPELPLQAGAWQAKLVLAGLPSATAGAVQDWLDVAGRAPTTPALQRAVLLTSMDKIWCGEMGKDELGKVELEDFLAACHDVGADRAAARYREIAQCLDDPDKLDEIMRDNNVWKYELEIATARYFLQHREEMLP